MIDLIYFSWIRERIGKSSERVETRASTVIELIEELALKGGGIGLFTGCAAGDTAMSIILRVDC